MEIEYGREQTVKRLEKEIERLRSEKADLLTACESALKGIDNACLGVAEYDHERLYNRDGMDIVKKDLDTAIRTARGE